MRRLVLSALSLVAILQAFAQPQHFGNEWINYNARYWSFAVMQEGVFRLDSTSLANAGFPLGQIDARTIQIFGREKQVPIWIPGDTDGVLNATDFIEFYAKPNDGWLDTALWDSPDHINNPYYSLISDSILYFITWDATPDKQRIIEKGPGDYNSQPQATWFYHESVVQPPVPFYQKGVRDPVDATTSWTGEAEGYWSFQLWQSDGGTYQETLVPTPLAGGVGAQAATVKLTLATTNDASGGACHDHHVKVYGGGDNQLQADTAFSGVHLLKYQFTLTPQQIAPATSIGFRFLHDQWVPDCNMQPDYPDSWGYGFISIKYAHRPEIMNTEFPHHMLLPNPVDPAPIHVIFNGNLNVPHLYVWGDTLRRYSLEFAGNYNNALVPEDASGPETHAYAFQDGSYLPIAQFLPVNGNGYFNDYAANNVDSAMVIVTHPTLMSGALQYAAYRESNPYNRYNTLVANVTELYQQFGGGVPRHPLGIRRFMGYLLNRFDTKPRALFLIGKSTGSAHIGGGDNVGYRRNAVSAQRCLVPSFGYPCGDNLLTHALSGDPWDATVPVGRLAAQTNQQVLDYLAKVQQLEGQHVGAWMKNILHFRGGFTLNEQILFDNALEGYRAIAEDTCFSGHVTKFVKNPDDLISQASADSVYNLIDEGVTLMTFFAHASGGGFDITIDQPNNYQWHGKYPMMIGNSCYTGNIHQMSSVSASEQFVMPANSGAIAFLASVDLGVTGWLYVNTVNFYESFSKVHYGESIGRHIQYMDSIALYSNGLTDIMRDAGIQQFTLHGDPTLILNSPHLPDYEIRDNDLRLSPNPITADVDTFQLSATIRNIGCGCRGGQFPVAVKRHLVEESMDLEPVIQQHVMQGWRDTLTFSLPVLQDSGGAGQNDFEVRVDQDAPVIEEIENDTNNFAHLHTLITSGDLLPVDPYNFAITPDASPLLQASTGDPFAPARNYIFQIDTTDLYNSPVMQQGTVHAPGGVVSWQPTSIYSLNQAHDSIVFFWRCAIDSVGNGGTYDWHEFSFQHIIGRKGWGQAHYFQFKQSNNNYEDILYDRPERDYDFYTGNRNIGCITRGNNGGICKWTKDLVNQEGSGCGSPPALHLAVVDPEDFVPWLTWWQGAGHNLGAMNDFPGSCTLSYRAQKVHIFRVSTPGQMTNLAHALSDSITDGRYILLYTYKYLDRNGIDADYPELINVLHGLGADNLFNGTVHDTVPYIFFCQKGNSNWTQEHWGERLDTTINMSVFLPVTGNHGFITPPPSCEALSWNSLHWQIAPNIPTDSAAITISTIDDNNVEHVAYTMQPSATTDSLRLDTVGVNSLLHQRLHLSGAFNSELIGTPKPAQPRRWQIVASPAPECAIDPPLGFFVHADSLYEGQIARVMVAVHNISDVGMTNLLISARITTTNNESYYVHYKWNAPLPAGGVVFDTIAFPLTGFAGLNSLVIEANPHDSLSPYHYDQREQYHFNNIATLRFETLRDRENPVLDATFDGIHILDGDIVSAQPEIKMTLDDENTSLLLNDIADTALIKVFLHRPNEQEFVRIYFRDHAGNEQLRFQPATGIDNICHIIYSPDLIQDGTYTLKVQASDVSRNPSADHDYAIRFEVINRPTITEVLNYPNPFTTSTRFVFVLTGHEVPTGLRIRIMTIGGRVVREIGLDEIGPLHVGRNISEYAWDGRDEFGDKLARGVYLYQVAAQLHGSDIEYRETQAGGYFTKGFGKMYLLR